MQAIQQENVHLDKKQAPASFANISNLNKLVSRDNKLLHNDYLGKAVMQLIGVH